MNSKNHFLRSFGAAFRGGIILLLVLSVFTATPARAEGGPDLIIIKSHTGGNFVPLETGRTYTLTVTNMGEDDTVGDVTVVDAPLSNELTVTNISGDGWNCSAPGTPFTCTHSDILSNGESYPPITVTVNVLVGAKDPQDNQATVSGGGEPAGDATLNNSTSYDIPVDATSDLIVLNYEIRDLTHAVITSPAPDENFYINVNVKNQGGALTESVVWAYVFVDVDPETLILEFGCVDLDVLSAREDYFFKKDLNDTLGAGLSAGIEIEIEGGLPAGDHQLYAYVDANCINNESIEDNNGYSVIPVEVTPPTASCTPPVGGPQVFQDVPTDFWARDYIEAMYYCGYTAGCSTSGPLMFCPDMTMNRAQSSVFLLRSRFGGRYIPPAPPYTTFKDDFSPGTWAQPWAQGLYNAGMTAGCASGSFKLFCPWDPATQAQLAVFGMRMKFGDTLPLPIATGTVFADMPITHWATGWAEQAYANGLILPCGSQNGQPLFCPDNVVSRASASYTIVKAKNLLP